MMHAHAEAYKAVMEALAILPQAMTSDKAIFGLLAIGWQESRLEHRVQIVQGKPGAKGPARGLWQFELGTKASRGGVWGVLLHPASRFWLNELCKARGVPFQAQAIWERLETDDVLAAGVARLLMFTDPKSLPSINDDKAWWDLYKRTWRPGKPHPQTWPEACRLARQFVLGLA